MKANPIAHSHTLQLRSVPRRDHKARVGVEGSSPHGGVSPIKLSTNWRRSDQFRLLEPQINAQKVHVWPFNANVPIELLLLDGDGDRTVSKNRHDYFEIFFVCSGATTFIVEDRRLPMEQGDMAIVGSTLHHSTQCSSHARSTIGALYFDPDFISGDGMACSADYLAPFLDQDPGFPHVVPAATGLPRQILDLMEMIQEEMPGSSRLARLAIKTYLRMITILLVKQYATHASGVDSFRQQQRALESLQKFFEFLPGHVGDMICAPDAARMCNLRRDRVCGLPAPVDMPLVSKLSQSVPCGARADGVGGNKSPDLRDRTGDGVLRSELFQCSFSQVYRHDPTWLPAPQCFRADFGFTTHVILLRLPQWRRPPCGFAEDVRVSPAEGRECRMLSSVWLVVTGELQ